MAHMVESMAYAGLTPWHGLGVNVEDNLTPLQMLVAAELDWTVSCRQMFTHTGTEIDEGTEIIPVLSHSVLVRDSDDKPLGPVGPRFVPTQNRDAFEFFKRFTSVGDMSMETAGSLKGGKQVWGLAKIKDGFTLAGDLKYTNNADAGFVAHCFKLAGSTTTNDASATSVGTIDSSYRANQDSGISVVTWTGTGSNGTIAHGLGRAPDCIIMKDVGQNGYHWEMYAHSGNAGGSPENNAASDEDHHIRFFDNSFDAPDDDHTYFNDTKPTSTVFSIGTANNVNQSGIAQMAICIANTNGSVRCGSYQGNGKAHGSYIFTGFRPRAVWTSGMLAEDPHWKTVTTRFTSNTNAAASSGGANHGNPIEHNLKF